ncbi:translation initiation factor IF-2-like [Penaeus chinensis]|uniref:translation initiation factor IF-2-like n=1 Tax=Penaeus chinensis TaxID=139456 RepID=UPI001FB5DC44|nr:translation initiation factor IF-2-like [Penaeus chinensis]
MKAPVLLCLCWLAVLGEGRPQAAEPPQVVDIAAAYEQYHQLWLAEAQRNSVAPLAPHKRPTQTAAATQEQPSKVPEPIAEVKQSPEPAAAEPEVKPAVAPEPVAPAAPDNEAALVAPDTAAAPDTLVADADTAYAEFHRLWLAEAARNAIAPTVGQQQPVATPAVQEEQPQMAVLQDQPAEQAQQAAPQEQVQQAAPLEQADTVAVEEPAAAPAEAAVDHEAEFARFHALWTQEAARNAIPPQVGAQPTQAQPETLQLVVEEAAPKATPAAPSVASPAPSAVVPASPWAGGFGSVPIVILLPQNPSGAP